MPLQESFGTFNLLVVSTYQTSPEISLQTSDGYIGMERDFQTIGFFAVIVSTPQGEVDTETENKVVLALAIQYGLHCGVGFVQRILDGLLVIEGCAQQWIVGLLQLDDVDVLRREVAEVLEALAEDDS